MEETTMAIEQYAGAELSLDRALKRVPDSYNDAYRWFLAHQGELGPRPFGNHAPKGIGVTLAAQRGIHKPSGMKYALSITSTNNQVYGGDQLHELDDGTWILQYCEHRRNAGEKEGSQQYNQSLRLCLRAGVPVGVFIREKTSYRCMGLAFVERFNEASGLFWLHGPVNPTSSLSPLSAQELRQYRHLLETATEPDFVIDETLIRQIKELPDERDERERVAACIVRRKNQDAFRRQLIEAYQGQCAMSRFDALPALQAAHISSYLGPKSQLASNGLLLRADLHLLFDESLIAVNPDTMRIAISQELVTTRYAAYADREILLPKDRLMRPSELRLAAQYGDFLQHESLLNL